MTWNHLLQRPSEPFSQQLSFSTPPFVSYAMYCSKAACSRQKPVPPLIHFFRLHGDSTNFLGVALLITGVDLGCGGGVSSNTNLRLLSTKRVLVPLSGESISAMRLLKERVISCWLERAISCWLSALRRRSSSLKLKRGCSPCWPKWFDPAAWNPLATAPSRLGPSP